MDEGYDYVGGVRAERHDTWFRRNASRMMNRIRERTTRIHMTDQGCMLRAYDRQVVEAINRCEEVNTFIPALAYTFSSNPTEVEVAHEERAIGKTKYSLYKLIRLNFDLVTGFSLAPLQAFSLVGFVLAAGSTGFVIFQIFHRLFRGQAAEGMFQSVTEAMQFFLFGVVLFGIGLLGEYIGRIYQEVLRRPRFIVSTVLEQQSTDTAAAGQQTAIHKTSALR
jgi:undecaprenyl-phosphate 4-deoxy-4-formamido-L-arabinose transferase